MKTIKALKVRELIKDLWPKVGFTWLTPHEDKFSMPTLSELEQFLTISKVDQERFTDGIKDCVFFSLILHAEAKVYYVNNADLEYPIAFGEVFATKFNGWTLKHNANITICEDKVYLVEPQTDEIHEGASDMDEILIVRM